MRTDDRVLDRSAEDGARVVALALLAEACAAAGHLSAGVGEEPLHDFRVAVRRLRSWLRSLRPWIAGSVRPGDERRLREAARATNSARDAEVQLAWLAGQRPAPAGREAAGRAFLAERLRARGRDGPDAERVAARFLRDAERLRRHLERYERRLLPGGAAPPRLRAVLATVARQELEAVSHRLRSVRGAKDERNAHRARIEAKRLRYLLEPLREEPLRERAGTDSAAAVARLKELQRVLGDLHDAHVLAGELRDALAEAADAGARDARPGLLALARAVRRRRDALYAELARGWRRRGLAALAREASAVADALASSPGSGGTRPAPARAPLGRRGERAAGARAPSERRRRP